MTETLRARYHELQDVITAAEFPELDLALRRGKHIDRDDLALFTLLIEAQDHLEAFYRRFGCELVHKTDGYFYLLPTGDKLSRRQLTPGDMLVGQALALLYLDPSTIERGGRTTQEDVVAQLVVVLGSDTLVHAFNPKQKRKLDERIAQKNVRARIGEGIRHLAALGFVDVADDGALRLRPSLLRFAEPVRGLSAPAEALAKLVATGEVALEPADPAESRSSQDDDELDALDVDESIFEDDGESEIEAAIEAGSPATATATAFASLLAGAPAGERVDSDDDAGPSAGDAVAADEADVSVRAVAADEADVRSAGTDDADVASMRANSTDDDAGAIRVADDHDDDDDDFVDAYDPDEDRDEDS